ncbi:unnamed protein product, partial [Amoebophrya sp. A25]
SVVSSVFGSVVEHNQKQERARAAGVGAEVSAKLGPYVKLRKPLEMLAGSWLGEDAVKRRLRKSPKANNQPTSSRRKRVTRATFFADILDDWQDAMEMAENGGRNGDNCKSSAGNSNTRGRAGSGGSGEIQQLYGDFSDRELVASASCSAAGSPNKKKNAEPVIPPSSKVRVDLNNKEQLQQLQNKLKKHIDSFADPGQIQHTIEQIKQEVLVATADSKQTSSEVEDCAECSSDSGLDQKPPFEGRATTKLKDKATLRETAKSAASILRLSMVHHPELLAESISLTKDTLFSEFLEWDQKKSHCEGATVFADKKAGQLVDALIEYDTGSPPNHESLSSADDDPSPRDEEDAATRALAALEHIFAFADDDAGMKEAFDHHGGVEPGQGAGGRSTSSSFLGLPYRE